MAVPSKTGEYVDVPSKLADETFKVSELVICSLLLSLTSIFSPPLFVMMPPKVLSPESNKVSAPSPKFTFPRIEPAETVIVSLPEPSLISPIIAGLTPDSLPV